MTVPPGWYPDPAEPTTRRYWDGEQWLPESPPSPASTPTPEVVADAPTDPGTAPVTLAAPGSRLAARVIDTAVLMVLNIVVNGYFFTQLLDEMMPALVRATNAYTSSGEFATLELTARAERLTLTMTFIALALWLAYEVPSLINTGQTLGKRLLGIRVLTVTAHTPRFGNALRRWGVTALPLLFPLVCGLPLVLLSAAWCLWDRPLRQSLHDKLGQTIVVTAATPTTDAKT